MTERTTRVLFLLLFAAVAGLYWWLRMAYWQCTQEIPFSDMLDIETIAIGIHDHWDFSSSPFWQSYKPPGLPMLRAISMFLGFRSLSEWQFFQTAIHFGMLALLVYELYSHGFWGRLMAVSVSATTAVSRASIFWSYKISTESMAEALLFASLAIAFRALRTGHLGWLFGAGLVHISAALVRPNLGIMIPVLLAFIVCSGAASASRERAKLLLRAVAFLLGVMVPWTPWLLRGVHLYGQPVWTSTQGPYTFLWEVGAVTIEDNGERITRDVYQLQAEAAAKFKNDVQAAAYASRFSKQWASDNWQQFPRIVLGRMVRQATSREEYLTKVPRQRLFGSLLDRLLIDKTPFQMALSLVALLLLPFFVRGWALMSSYLLAVFGFGALFLGYARIFDPLLSLVLGIMVFLVLASLAFLVRKVRQIVDMKQR